MLLGVMLILNMPVALPTVSAGVKSAQPAPCHDDERLPPVPQHENHDCCLIGHNHPLPESALPFCPRVVISSVAVVSAPAFSMRSDHEPVVAAIDSGPPPDALPLRI